MVWFSFWKGHPWGDRSLYGLLWSSTCWLSTKCSSCCFDPICLVLLVPIDVLRDHRTFDDGAFAERLNLKGYILLLICWTILVYIPVCHWVWGEGFLSKWGFVDFAGGTVIHTTAGFAALASIFVLGKRKVAKQGMHPNNLMAAAIGTGLLWFGWFGFNSGGALSAGALATKAFTNTLVGLAGGMIAWLIMAKILRGKINFVDVMTGSVAGLATITPCAGYIAPSSAIIVGIVAGIICNLAVGFRQRKAGTMRSMFGAFTVSVVLLGRS